MSRRRLIMTISLAVTCVIAILVLFAVSSAKADGETYHLYVLRPKISLNANRDSGRIKVLTFGTELKLLSQNYDYCQVEDPEGDVGYVYTGFIGYAVDRIWLSKGGNSKGVYLSPEPGMNPHMFGYAAGGQRMSEMAIVLYENDGYYYIITEEGFSGFVYKYDANIQPYEYHLQEEEQNQEQGVG